MTTYAYRLDTPSLEPGMSVRAFPPSKIKPVTLNDPAILAMTDLKQTRAITINPDKSVELALELMKYAGVRLLVVADQNECLAGLITARDIMGEKLMSIMTRDQVKREEIEVKQVMTPRAELNPFYFRDVEHATVRDVILKLRDAARQHAIVIEEEDDKNGYFVRGIFSITQIGRQLGMEIEADGHVQSFAEFEQLFA